MKRLNWLRQHLAAARHAEAPTTCGAPLVTMSPGATNPYRCTLPAGHPAPHRDNRGNTWATPREKKTR